MRFYFLTIMLFQLCVLNGSEEVKAPDICSTIWLQVSKLPADPEMANKYGVRPPHSHSLQETSLPDQLIKGKLVPYSISTSHMLNNLSFSFLGNNGMFDPAQDISMESPTFEDITSSFCNLNSTTHFIAFINEQKEIIAILSKLQTRAWRHCIPRSLEENVRFSETSIDLFIKLHLLQSIRNNAKISSNIQQITQIKEHQTSLFKTEREKHNRQTSKLFDIANNELSETQKIVDQIPQETFEKLMHEMFQKKEPDITSEVTDKIINENKSGNRVFSYIGRGLLVLLSCAAIMHYRLDILQLFNSMFSA